MTELRTEKRKERTGGSSGISSGSGIELLGLFGSGGAFMSNSSEMGTRTRATSKVHLLTRYLDPITSQIYFYYSQDAHRSTGSNPQVSVNR